MKNLLHTLPSLSSIVNRTPAIGDPAMLLSEAIDMMSQNHIVEAHSAVLVLEQARLVGIFTEQDLVRLTATQTDLRGIKMGAVMTKNPHTLVLSPEVTVITVLGLLEQYKIHHLPIVDDQARLVGTISTDAIRQILVDSLQAELLDRAAALEQTNAELRLEIDRREQVEARLHRAAHGLEERMALRVAEALVLTDRVETMRLDRESVDLALATSQSGISDFMQNALIGIHWVSEDGIVLWANPAELAMLGYEAEEYIGQPLHDFHVDRAAIGCAFQRLLEDEPILGHESQMIRKDGSICDVSIDSNALFKNGKFVHGRCFTRDISEQKQAAAALRQNERKFQAIFNGAFGFVGLLDTDGIVLEVNRTATIAMGPAANIIGQPFGDTLWWNHSPALQQELQAAIALAATGERVRFESHHILADGSQIAVDFSLSPIFDETGKVVMLIPEGRDITARKAREQQIAEQAAMLNIATDAIIVRNLVDFTIEFWNDGAEMIYGWPAAEVVGLKTTVEIFQKDPAQVDMTALATVLEQGIWQGELHKLTKSGRPVIVESRCSLVRDAAGNPKSILSVETDITAKKQLEQQFIHVQRLESLGTLATGIAHDLNNIFTPILCAVHLLPLTLPPLDEQNQRLLTMLTESTQRGSSLVKQILAFGKGGISDAPIALQARHILNEVVSVARQTFPKSITITLDIGRVDLWLVCVDPTHIHQVLMNLFINARDAMPDGGTITATAHNVMIEKRYVKLHPDVTVGAYTAITIADTGSGMDQPTIDRIFDTFFTTKASGTGLGLSTVLGIVKAHGGFIDVQSTPGRGSAFKIHLPAVNALAVNPIADRPVTFDGKGQLVLVIDDEAAIRTITKDTLERYNYQVMLASDGVSALDLYAQNWQSTAIVMIDMIMPHLDTPSVIKLLQRINPDVEIIVMSGSEGYEGMVEQYGLRAFLTKPFTTIALMQALTVPSSN
jgi:PAS domain S-box-containing protein